MTATKCTCLATTASGKWHARECPRYQAWAKDREMLETPPGFQDGDFRNKYINGPSPKGGVEGHPHLCPCTACQVGRTSPDENAPRPKGLL